LKDNNNTALDNYIKLASLSGFSGNFTKLGISGLPLATIVLTIFFTFIGILPNLEKEMRTAAFDLAKLTLGAFLGSFVQKSSNNELKFSKEKETEQKGTELQIKVDKKNKDRPAIASVIDKENYIKGPEKFPLETGRWGYLPVSIQNFFQDYSSTCQISKTNTNLKPNHTCLLRHGVEFNEKQSFVACISDAKYYGETQDIPNIVDMKKIIISALNIDDYITYQNGNNVSNFMIEDKTILNGIDFK
jgi:hypothetical protein